MFVKVKNYLNDLPFTLNEGQMVYMGAKTRIYLRTSELRDSLAGITNLTQRILIRK